MDEKDGRAGNKRQKITWRELGVYESGTDEWKALLERKGINFSNKGHLCGNKTYLKCSLAKRFKCKFKLRFWPSNDGTSNVIVEERCDHHHVDEKEASSHATSSP